MSILIVYSKNGCPRCDMYKRNLTSKGIEFQAVQFESLDEETQDYLIAQAIQTEASSFPIVVKDGVVMKD